VEVSLEIHIGAEEVRDKVGAETARENAQTNGAAIRRGDDGGFLDLEIVEAELRERLPVRVGQSQDRFGAAEIHRRGEFWGKREQNLRVGGQFDQKVEGDRRQG